MSQAARVIVFYSADSDYRARLSAARMTFSDAHVIAVVPGSRPLTESERSLVDEVYSADPSAYSPHRIGRFLSLLGALRAYRADLFIVMFDSLRLGLLGSASGARRVECWDGEMRIIRLPRITAVVPLRAAGRACMGHLRWLARAATVYGPDLWQDPPTDYSRPEGRISARELRYRNRLARLNESQSRGADPH